jgi:hypothetical protein
VTENFWPTATLLGGFTTTNEVDAKELIATEAINISIIVKRFI